MTKKKEVHDCIDADKVPCPKARAYLKKHGRLCGTGPAHALKPKRKHRKGWISRLLGL